MSVTVLEWLLVATGFMGGLTIVFLARWLWRRVAAPPAWAVFFSPKGGCSDALLREIRAARREVLVQAFQFGSRPLAQALVDAKLRGLRVDILLDWGAEKDATGDLKFFQDQGLSPLINSQFLSAHDKVVIVDGKTVITGSFDFTQQAEEDNGENLLVIKGQADLARKYRERFETLKGKCQPPGAREPTVPAAPAAKPALLPTPRKVA
jgi:phosphatidylserine/phosphatidylglycerophosphate/cardiolipin synthase-like enzyme